MLKFWLDIYKDEHLKRFKPREDEQIKQYKITYEDLSKREKWELCDSAVEDILSRTNTSYVS